MYKRLVVFSLVFLCLGQVVADDVLLDLVDNKTNQRVTIHRERLSFDGSEVIVFDRHEIEAGMSYLVQPAISLGWYVVWIEVGDGLFWLRVESSFRYLPNNQCTERLYVFRFAKVLRDWKTRFVGSKRIVSCDEWPIKLSLTIKSDCSFSIEESIMGTSISG